MRKGRKPRVLNPLPRLDVSYRVTGPGEYSAVVRPSEGEKPRTVGMPKADLYPDHNAYLIHKGAELTAWAHQEFAPAIASRIENFMRTRNPVELATLTDLEREQLFAKAEELQIPLKSGGRYRV